jgi:MFS family permease
MNRTSVYSRSYRRYVGVLLTIVYVFNQLDRMVFNILMEPIKHEFSLTDTQLGFLAGPAQVLIYACLGIVVARWADRHRRIAIMTVAIILWSAMAALTATAHDFWQLVLVRVGVGVGEAGFSAVALSVIGDYASDKDRTRALASFALAMPIASLIGDSMGGWVNELYGWRLVFILAGAPGILLALLMRMTVQEPPRRVSTSSDGSGRASLPLVLSTLWRRRSLRHLMIGQALANIVVTSMSWISVLFIRQHGMSTGELGSWFAVTDVVGGMGGIWLSGFLVSRYGAKDAGMKARLMAYAAVLAAPLAIFVLWCPFKHAALLGFLLLNVPVLFFIAPTYALVQDLVGANMRATMAAVFTLTQMLAGGVIGTQLVGLLSDALAPIAGNSTLSLRWGMAIGSMLTLGAALNFWLAARFVRQDLSEPATAVTSHSLPPTRETYVHP